MEDDLNLLIAEAKIREDMTDEDIGNAVSMKKSSIRNARHNHTLSNLPFWKVSAIARLAGYEVDFVRKGE